MGSVPTPDPDPDRGGRGSGSAENRGGGACPGFSVRPSTLFLEALAARCPQLFRPPNRAVPTARRSAVTHAPPIAAGGPPARPSRVLRFLRASHARFGLDLMASAGAGAPWAEVTRPLVAASSHTRRTAWGRYLPPWRCQNDRCPVHPGGARTSSSLIRTGARRPRRAAESLPSMTKTATLTATRGPPRSHPVKLPLGCPSVAPLVSWPKAARRGNG